MTKDDVIEIIKDVTWKDFGRHPDFPEAREAAIQALNEVEEYRAIGTPEELRSLKERAFTGIELAQIAAMQMRLKEYERIGTPEECRAAMEKQTEKQIIDNTPTEDDMWYQCPACRGDLTKIRSFYCPYCGQKLSWNSERYCSTCTWYDVDNGVCCNGESEHRADFCNLDDTCEKWEEKQ